MLSPKHRDLALQSFEDIPTASSTSSLKSIIRAPISSGNSLPIPVHIRAASTPVCTETTTKTEITAQHKRFPSNVESLPRHNASDPGFRKDTKKFSVDAFDRLTKRASSEAKEKISSKRNTSSPAAISLLNFTNEALQKLTLEEIKQQQQQKNKKDKSGIKATPELLAELLKGSSEKLATAEKQQQQQHRKQQRQVDNGSIALPTAVLRFLVSEFMLSCVK